MASSPTKMSLKLLIDTKTESLLFAEASKELIDFLFNLFRLPLGTVTRLLTKDDMVGSLGKLYECIENLSDTYLLHPNQDKEALLKPRATIPGFLLLANYGKSEEEFDPTKLYMCSWNRCNYAVTHVKDTACPNCSRNMNISVPYVGKKATEVTGSSGEGGYVKDVVTYMLMDDLVVQPMSAISCITLLSKFNIKDVTSLQERVVEVGMEEGIRLLKAALQSRNALTSVFLNNIWELKEAE